MPAQVGRTERNGYNVADTRGDLLLAPGADIGFSGVVRMDAAYSEALVGGAGSKLDQVLQAGEGEAGRRPS